MMDAALAETLSDTAIDAEGAYQRVRALLELLNGCPPEHPLSAGLFVGLVESVGERMANGGWFARSAWGYRSPVISGSIHVPAYSATGRDYQFLTTARR